MGNRDKHAVLTVEERLTSGLQGGNAFGIDTCSYNPAGWLRKPAIPGTYEMTHGRKRPPVVEVRQ